MKGEIRSIDILKAALYVAEHSNYNHMTRAQVASAAKCSESLVSVYYGTMTQLKRSVMRYAIKQENLKVIAQGLIRGDKEAKKANQMLKEKALSSIIN